ncbi:MAG: hypothetical protein WA003_12500, partial [Desulfuromonadaceae bacterium]
SVLGTGGTAGTSGSGYCAQCHGYPPLTENHAGMLATDCIGCHSHVNSSGTGFTDPTHHINGLVEAAGGHSFPYGGSVHMPGGTGTLLANTIAPYTNCSVCHDTTTTGGTYPVNSGTAPLCSACHINMTNFTGTSPGCWDCHGASATNGRPNSTSFPNRQGEHGRTQHLVACTVCHPITTGSASHGWSNRTTSTNAQVLPALNWDPGTRTSGQGSCNPAAGGFTGCHSSISGWY